MDCIHLAEVGSQVSGSCEHGNELSASIKDGTFLANTQDSVRWVYLSPLTGP
jgi:hypothetical protein